MGYTNKTPNYDLPQYVGTDKPTYLGDFNETMLKIDTALHTNQQNIANANSAVTTANATANQALQSATDADTKASTASTTANQAKTIAESATDTANNAQDDATTANNNITALTQLLNISQISTINASSITVSQDSGSATIDSSTLNLKLATNQTQSLGKIYGLLRVRHNTSQNTIRVIIQTNLKPTTNITINESINVIAHGPTINEYYSKYTGFTILTNGQIHFSTNNDMGGSSTDFHLLPFLYFLKDFGDSIPDTPIS